MSQKWKPLKQVGVIGVPFEKGQKKYGVSVAPAAMRSAGLIEQLREIDGLDVKDYGDIDIPSCHEAATVDNMAYLPLVSACNRSLSNKMTQVLNDGRLAVTIGGDHSIGVGTVDGHYSVNEDMILIWVDAHADINTNKTSDSGSVHGMPVALLVKELSDYWPYLPTMDWQVPKFSIKNLGYIGLRSVDHYERLAIEKYKVPTFAMEDIEDHGIRTSINHILHVLDPEKKKPIHVSFDIDSLDALEAPSTGTSVRGGLTLREAIKLMEIIHSTGRLRALDLVEINPAIGNDSDRKRTIEAGLCILKAALGFSRRGTSPRGATDLPIISASFKISSCLETKQEKESGEEKNGMRAIADKYFSKISNIESKYIINEGLSKTISNLLQGKVNAFPLYKVSLSLDRKPVKIPWTLDLASPLDDSHYKKKFKYLKIKKVPAPGN
ncbi:unnamed protein product [Leptosia nina]|uniref:Arginase n=1 Tax=Leptosia nina TaxID=320188 RepID=A0AAV1JJR3_9NEOP